jgi:hypothetical protein
MTPVTDLPVHWRNDAATLRRRGVVDWKGALTSLSMSFEV